ncbi:ferritin-like domain-containing protein [Campylobacter sp. RM9344]|uniref:Ferritin-like domain-containing protein n=1 Tax=Campylobacter californiensis TaxID=1032243 RepID=A0AAW3ZSY9_9BACT|nr:MULTISPECIES: ferritin-like domain-containing protein [unclassified Campylobacter]MBE2985056.1 ferritin-like domain-containing protein [Campylobacter sp. RM6883]MBE2986609.1 ferritin-like domain-containing protein [Campylobacter sp. RM12919]MBE2987596.1 ferritin-like domain-containing protein [Campylobacter sp. RM12920]MBE2995619.1 ferritin-like domain-containing protein [Campylobacter sp. RM6913]MBE3029219.1 ferritin-like domain-containing protein [Campylobacter sp. RM9344]
MHNDFLDAAYLSEKNAQILYEILNEFDDVFREIYALRQNAITLIQTYAKVKKLKLNEDETQNAFLKPTCAQDAFICALNYEIQLNKMYENFCENLDDDELKDLFFRLWATSNNEYIVALKAKLSKTMSSDKDDQNNIKNLIQNLQEKGYEGVINEYQENFAKISNDLQDIISGKADKAQMMKILNNPNFSFFSGLALGALGISIVGKNLEPKDK